MGSLCFPELNLDSPFSVCIPKTIAKFMAEVSGAYDEGQKILLVDDCIYRLQDEMKKIEAFKRELPLCMDLLNDAILEMKNVLLKCKKSDDEPVLEQFLPLNRSKVDERFENVKENDVKDKRNWMDSVQLWNSDSEGFHCPNSKMLEEEEDSKKKREFNDNPLQMMAKEEEEEDDDESPEMTGLSLCLPETKNNREEISSLGLSPKSCCSRSGSSSATNGTSNFKAGTARKQRRSWSPELHRRFLNALHQLGGAKAATPKQIREHMQVDGLTNDEVKSHLQKYRLHARKIPATTESMKQRNTHSNSPNGRPFLLISMEEDEKPEKGY